MTVQREGEKAENQQKAREKSKVAESLVFWLDFCAKKGLCIHPLAIVKIFAGIGIPATFIVSSKKIEEGYKRYRLCFWC
jgi:hypothetical protein